MRASKAAASFLIRCQDVDGYWRDYQLAPGRSEAWTTACVGYALLAASRWASTSRAPLDRAAAALLAARRPGGWGYNNKTACDADSTSWVIRFLARHEALGDVPAAGVLSPYVTATYRIRTFASFDRFGSWATEHDEVAPMAGLALLAAREDALVARIRAAVLDSWAERGWRPFWWQGRSYVCAQSLEFLSLTGGIPDEVSESERHFLAALSPSTSAFDTAQRLVAALHVNAMVQASHLHGALIDLQCSDGGWPGSPVLLVPHQGEPSVFEIACDDRRLLTTAVSLMAISRWVERDGSE